MPDEAAVLYALLAMFAACCAASVAVPLFFLLVRVWRYYPHEAPFTLKTALLGASLAIQLGWRACVFFDYGAFDQRYLGSIADRWRLELVVLLPVMIAAVYTAVLYHTTITLPRLRARRGRP